MHYCIFFHDDDGDVRDICASGYSNRRRGKFTGWRIVGARVGQAWVRNMTWSRMELVVQKAGVSARAHAAHGVDLSLPVRARSRVEVADERLVTNHPAKTSFGPHKIGTAARRQVKDEEVALKLFFSTVPVAYEQTAQSKLRAYGPFGSFLPVLDLNRRCTIGPFCFGRKPDASESYASRDFETDWHRNSVDAVVGRTAPPFRWSMMEYAGAASVVSRVSRLKFRRSLEIQRRFAAKPIVLMPKG